MKRFILGLAIMLCATFSFGQSYEIIYGPGPMPTFTPNNPYSARFYHVQATDSVWLYDQSQTQWELIHPHQHDSTRVVQDSIVVGWINGVEVSRDTISLVFGGSSFVDSTRLDQDSILLYYENGSLIGQDTIRLPGFTVPPEDSTRLLQDSILVYYVDGSEIGRDTIRLSVAGAAADSTRIVQDSIAVYYSGGSEVGRDTIRGIGSDDQILTYVAGTNMLTIEDGNTVDLSDLSQTLNYFGAGFLQISDENSVDMSDLLDNTDNQTVDSFLLTGTILTITLEDDNEAPYTVDLASIDTDNQTVDSFLLIGNLLTITLEDDNEAPYQVDLSGYLDNTDAQTLTWVQSTGVLTISGGNSQTILVMAGATGVADGEQGLVPKPVAGEHILFLRGDGTWANPSVGGDNWGSQVVISDATLTGDGTGGDPLMVADPNTDNQTVDTFNLVGATITLALEDDNEAPYTIDVTTLADSTRLTQDSILLYFQAGAEIGRDTIRPPGGGGVGTDDQNLTYNGLGDLEIEDGNSVDMSDLLDNTDNQTVDTFSLTGTVLSIALEDDNEAPYTVDLASINTDNQTVDSLILIGNLLTITLRDDNESPYQVDLSAYLDNTDNQTVDSLLLIGNLLTITLEGDNEAPYQVDLSAYLDNTDDQQIDNFSIVTNTLTLEIEDDGQAPQTVDLSPYLDNTDDQGVDNFDLTGTTLTIELEDDGALPYTVDLSSLDDSGTDNQTVDTFQLDGTILSITLEDDNEAPYTVELSALVGTDDQAITTFDIVADQLRIQVEDDAGGLQTVDLSAYLDNTDAQTLSWVQSTGVLTISGGNNQTILAMVGATDVADGEQGLVPKPVAGEEGSFLRGDGTWANPSVGGDNWGSQVVVSDGTLSGDGTGGNALSVVGVLTDNQTVDSFLIIGNLLTITLEDDNEAPYQVDLSAYLDNTDNQTVDSLILIGNLLTVTLRDDNEAPYQVDLSAYLDNTDDQQIDNFSIVTNTLSLEIEDDGQAAQTVDLSPYLDNTDNQTVDTFSLTGTTITLALEDDNEAPYTLDLASLPGDDWGTQVAQTDATLTGDGTGGSPLSVVSMDNVWIDSAGYYKLFIDTTLANNSFGLNVDWSVDGNYSNTFTLDDVSSAGIDFLSGTFTLTANQQTAYGTLNQVYDETHGGSIQSRGAFGGLDFIGFNNASASDAQAFHFRGFLENEPTAEGAMWWEFWKHDGAGALTNFADASNLFRVYNASTPVFAIKGNGDVAANIYTGNGRDLAVTNPVIGGTDFMQETLDDLQQTIDTFSLSGNTLTLALKSDDQIPQTVDLSGYLDNTDAQNLTYNGSGDLDISGGTDVDLSDLLDNTDNQTVDTFSLVGTELRLALENDNEAPYTVELSSLQDGNGIMDATTGLPGGTVVITALGQNNPLSLEWPITAGGTTSYTYHDGKNFNYFGGSLAENVDIIFDAVGAGSDAYIRTETNKFEMDGAQTVFNMLTDTFAILSNSFIKLPTLSQISIPDSILGITDWGEVGKVAVTDIYVNDLDLIPSSTFLDQEIPFTSPTGFLETDPYFKFDNVANTVLLGDESGVEGTISMYNFHTGSMAGNGFLNGNLFYLTSRTDGQSSKNQLPVIQMTRTQYDETGTDWASWADTTAIGDQLGIIGFSAANTLNVGKWPISLAAKLTTQSAGDLHGVFGIYASGAGDSPPFADGDSRAITLFNSEDKGVTIQSIKNTVDSAATVTPLNFLYTDANGRLLSGDIDSISGVGGGGATELSDLTDVNTSIPTVLNVLVADGVDWESRALTTADIQSGTFADARISAASVVQHVSDAVYSVSWDADTGPASKNSIYDKIETIVGSGDGIYDGSGTIPTTTDAQVTDDFAFTDGTNDLIKIDASTGHTGIGLGSTPTTYYSINVNETFTGGISSSFGGLQISPVWTGGATASGGMLGIFSAPSVSGTDQLAYFYGSSYNPSYSSSATLATLQGVRSRPSHSGSGGVTSMAGLYTQVRETGAGTVTIGYGLNVDVNSGTFTNAYGVNVNDQTATTSVYGVATGISSGAGKYNIYAHGTADNYFSGDVGIGDSTPDAKLDVAGSMRLDAAFIDASGDSGSAGQILSSTAVQTNWIDPPAAGATTLDALTDVTITTVADNEIFQYDNGSGDWINQTLAEAGISATGHTHVPADINIDAGTDLTTGVHATQDFLMISDNGTEKKVTVNEILGGGVKQIMEDSTTINFLNKAALVIDLDLNSATTMTVVAISNLPSGRQGAIHLFEVSGSNTTITWPATVYLEDDTAAGAEVYTAGQVIPIYYNAARSRYYIPAGR